MGPVRTATAVLAIVVGAACAGRPPGQLVRQLGRSPGGKTAGVYTDPAFGAGEPQPVAEHVVVRALQSSSFFSNSDIQALAGPIAQALAKLASRERIIIVGGESVNPAQYHLYVRRGELQIVMYRADQEVSRHTTVVPKH
jgi:hypothetical protein